MPAMNVIVFVSPNDKDAFAVILLSLLFTYIHLLSFIINHHLVHKIII